jgi:putative transposase
VHDQLATGRKLRVLTIIDTFSRFSPATEVRFNFRGADVVEVLERLGRNEERPHSAIGNKPPIDVMNRSSGTARR